MYPPPPNSQPPPMRYPPFPPKSLAGGGAPHPLPPPPISPSSYSPHPQPLSYPLPPNPSRYDDHSLPIPSVSIPSRPGGGYTYEQPRNSFEDDVYDPYQPSSTSISQNLNPMPAPTLTPTTSGGPYPHMPPFPPTALPQRPLCPIKHNQNMSRRSSNLNKTTAHQHQELSLITPPTLAMVGSSSIRIHSLPPSHLPITKYIACSPSESVDTHRSICSREETKSVWYAVGSTRAGEGWASAVEWNLETGMSGMKMRGCVQTEDSLDTELAAINKAVDAFRSQLEQSIKLQKPTSRELIVFCDSQAAIVSIDTSSRPESIRFCRMWKQICSEFLQAHLTLVWVAKETTDIEGYSLTLKIATVAASNSYLKRRKERTIPEKYMKAGNGDVAPGGSSRPGAWQTGDADPTFHKSPFQPPINLTNPSPPRSPAQVSQQRLIRDTDVLPTNGIEMDQMDQHPHAVGDTEEESTLRPRPDVLCVAHFPNNASAKDLGILFAQFGDIVSVDIFSIPPVTNRFAYVAFTHPNESNVFAIQTLHRRPIQLDTPFARTHSDDLAIWKGFHGVLSVVQTDNERLIPIAIARDFPELPALANENLTVAGENLNKRFESPASAEGEEVGRKRPRESRDTTIVSDAGSYTVSSTGSPSPKKQARVEPGPSKLAKAFNKTPAISLTQNNYHPHPDQNFPNKSSNSLQINDLHSLLQPNYQSEPLIKEEPITTPPTPFTINQNVGDNNDRTHHSHTHAILNLPPTPLTAHHSGVFTDLHLKSPPGPNGLTSKPDQVIASSPLTKANKSNNNNDSNDDDENNPNNNNSNNNALSNSQSGNPTNSAAEPQEFPIKIGVKTLRAQLDLVRNVFIKHDTSNWIAHTCLIATDLDQARRNLQNDLYATDEAFISGQELEQILVSRGFTLNRIDLFIKKVLKVLDGIALADELEAATEAGNENVIHESGEKEGDTDGNGKSRVEREIEKLTKELDLVMERFPEQTRESMSAAGKVLEYLNRGKLAQEKKRLEVERRVKVLEGMVKIGEQVSSVVRYLLTEDK